MPGEYHKSKARWLRMDVDKRTAGTEILLNGEEFIWVANLERRV